MNKCTIVMYHYVRDLKNSRYPAIKGLDVEQFKQQIDWLQKNYCFVSIDDIIKAVYGEGQLPERAVLLTFDDAYIDHFNNVFPLLDERGIRGAFFPPAKAIVNHEVLDVNKIHFILASANINDLLSEISVLLMKYRKIYNLKSYDEYYAKLAKRNRFDSGEVIFVKRLLQVELDETVRKLIVDELFKEFVTEDEAAFSRELYMNIDQMKCMVRHGMDFGSHGYAHYWLNHLSSEQQEVEIDRSMQLLDAVGVDMKNWVMCYPYGAWDDNLISILKKKHCKLGITTEVKQAVVDESMAFRLPRFDTNDFPPKSENWKNL